MNVAFGPTKLGWSRVPVLLKVVVYAAAFVACVVMFDLALGGASSLEPAEAVLAVVLVVAACGVWLERRFPRVLVTVTPAVLHVTRLAAGHIGWRQWREWVFVGVTAALLWWFLYFNDVLDDYYIMLQDAADRQSHGSTRRGGLTSHSS